LVSLSLLPAVQFLDIADEIGEGYEGVALLCSDADEGFCEFAAVVDIGVEFPAEECGNVLIRGGGRQVGVFSVDSVSNYFLFDATADRGVEIAGVEIITGF